MFSRSFMEETNHCKRLFLTFLFNSLLMKKLVISLCLIFVCFLGWSQPNDSTAELRIQIQDVRTNNGQIYVILYNTPIGFPQETEKARGFYAISSVSTPVSTLDLDGINYGEYALLVVHDERRVGMPSIQRTEVPKLPFGFSNLYSLPFFMPKWEKVVFTLDKPEVIMDVKMLY